MLDQQILTFHYNEWYYIDMDNVKKVIDLYQSGLSISAVAQHLNLTTTQVHYRLVKSNTPRRPNSINSRKSTLNEYFFKDINSINSYWIGVIAADGYIGKYKHSSGIVSITQKYSKENYDWLLQYLKDAGSNLMPRQYKQSTSYGDVHYVKASLTSGNMYNDLSSHGIATRKSLRLKPPETMGKHVRHWIRGYFDGDGSASLSLNRIKIRFCGTQEVLEWISSQLPIEKVYWSKRHVDDTNNYQIEVSRTSDVCKTIDYLYDEAERWLPRKRERCESFRAQY